MSRQKMLSIDEIAANSSRWVTLAMGVEAFACRGSASRPLAVVTAGIHGDEYEGPVAVAELTKRLEAKKMAGSVIAIPAANPLAVAAATRTTPEDGLNLARTFPGKHGGTVTERLAAELFEVAGRADYLIDLHSGGVEYCFLPTACFYGEPTVENSSYQAARHFGLSTLWQAPLTPGVLSHELWKRGIVSLGAEYLGVGQLSAEGASQYVDGVLSCLARWGICPTAKILPPGGQAFAGDWQLATAGGIFHARCALGECARQGQLLAEIRNLRGEMLEEFFASSPGTVLALRSKAYINPGNWAVLVGTGLG
jgi:predicted deacylase